MVVVLRRTGADDGGARGFRVVRVNFRNRVRASEDDRVGVHRLDHFLGNAVRSRNADENVRALHRFGETARNAFLIRHFRDFLFRSVQARVALANNSLRVADDHVFDAERDEEFRDRDTRGPGAVHRDFNVFHFLAGNAKSVQKRGGGDDRGAVLVVVEDRNIELFLEALFDFEATRRGNVFEVDAAEATGKEFDRFDDLFSVFGTDAERERVDVGERLEERAFAFHHRHPGFRPDVAESQNGGAVGDDRNGVPTTSQFEGEVDVFANFAARLGDARRVGERKFFATADRNANFRFDFTAPFGVFLERFFVVIDGHWTILPY